MRRQPYTLLLTTLLALVLWSGAPAPAADAETITAPLLATALVDAAGNEAACLEALARVEAQHQTMQQEMRRLHRELAALRADQAKPDLTEILGGVGYIIGLCGLYAWSRSRRHKEVS
jgi:hypothetical protein